MPRVGLRSRHQFLGICLAWTARGGVCLQVGEVGTVIRSTDYKTWTEISSGVSTMLTNVDMISATTAIAVGTSGTILKTTDGGVTWSSITGVTTEDVFGVSMVSPSVAYIAAQDGHVLKTTDGGTTWTDVGSTLSGIDAYTIDAYSSSVVYVAGKSGVAYRTTEIIGSATISKVQVILTQRRLRIR